MWNLYVNLFTKQKQAYSLKTNTIMNGEMSQRRINQKLGMNTHTEEVKWSEVALSCPILCDPMDCSPPGSSVHGIFQARILEWVAISFSRGSSWPRNWTHLCRLKSRFCILTRSPKGMWIHLKDKNHCTDNRQREKLGLILFHILACTCTE